MKLDPEELPQELREITSDITSIPGTLYFTAEVFTQLTELCVLKRLTPTQLIVEAVNSQRCALGRVHCGSGAPPQSPVSPKSAPRIRSTFWHAF
jgi:hypothetical protein